MSETKKSKASLLPLGYGLLATLAVLVLLPSALRPPPDETQASGAFGADAPPDEDPDVIIQTLEQARSQTAGGLGRDGDTASVAVVTTTTIPAPEVVRTLGSCRGTPPRQVESEYAGPCVPIWQGDNGGSTSQGVTADEIRVAIWHDSVGAHEQQHTGRVSDSPPPDGEEENAADRAYRYYQKYFNENFEFYGRKLQFIVDQGPNNGDVTEDRAHAVASNERWGGLFGSWAEFESMMLPSAEQGIVSVGGIQVDHDVYADRRPYLYGFHMDADQVARFNAEYICKRISGHPARWAGSPLIRQQERKFGFLGSDDAPGLLDVPAAIEQRCGIEVYAHDLSGGYANEALVNAFANFQVEGVTSIIMGVDPIHAAAVVNYASGQSYYPEWVISAGAQLDNPANAGLFQYDPQQWKHAFGISAAEFRGDIRDNDWYRAHKSVSPNEEPYLSGNYVFEVMLQFANGIQAVGPNLTPETFSQGLFALPKRLPVDQFICCGFTQENLTYADTIREIFWIPEGFAPNCDYCRGNFVYPECEAQYREGQMPTGEPAYYEGGCLRPGDGRAHPSQGGDPGLYGDESGRATN